ncbi:uncharacterized protein EV154DRAFT_504066 [Mucor mucedo]|uniref:uncharacterized protein n=1 Tax=Mucor mucedo TaxID=29922 RepID=UPI00222096A8|nr:uncharacterized protein EV154DRAFT_504066 [Mucor mucedo]KAI7892774.1 hypothetical protein EV154DRAFT_504066 [Mucor mucedo]
MKAVFIILALCISFVFAQSTVPFYITHPLQGDSFKAGSTVTIEWKNGVAGSTKVALLTGVNAASMSSTGVTFNVEGSAEEYDWKVPTDLPQNATFSLQISYVDPTTKAAATSYSAAFTLTGTTGDIVTQSFVSVIATAVSSVPPKSSIIATALSSIPASASASVTRVTPSASISKAPSSTASASVTPAPTSAAGVTFKASAMVIGAVAMVATALIL